MKEIQAAEGPLFTRENFTETERQMPVWRAMWEAKRREIQAGDRTGRKPLLEGAPDQRLGVEQ